MKRNLRILIASLLVAVLLIPFLGTSSIFAEEIRYEYLSSGGDADSNEIYGTNFTAMQFTVGSSAHTVTKIKAFLMRSGSPGTLTCALRTATAGVPTGEDLASGTASGNGLSAAAYSLVTFTLDAEVSLEAGEEYAIVISALNGDAGNYALWWVDSGGGLADAVSCHSIDGGATWVDDTPVDCLFEIWGNTVLSIVNVAVFQDYIADGDLLICAQIINLYPPYNTTEIAKDYFQFQFLDTDGTTVLASTPFTAWGNAPESIYLSPTSAGSITYGGGYYVQVVGTFTSPPSVSQILISSNWKGDHPQALKDWVIKTAYSIEDYYGWSGTTSALTQYVTQSGVLLTDTGGAIFTNAIPGLATQLPSLFGVVKSKPLFPTATANNTFDTVPYATMVGTPIASDMQTFGDLFSISGKDLGGWIIAVAIACVIFIGVILGGGMAAMPVFVIAGLPLLFIGNYTRIIGIQWTVIIAIALYIIFSWRFWWSRT